MSAGHNGYGGYLIRRKSIMGITIAMQIRQKPIFFYKYYKKKISIK